MTNCPANCDTVQLLEPNDDLLVDTGGPSSDVDERGELVLEEGQSTAAITFAVNKISVNYHFEYLYVDALGVVHPGSVAVVPVEQSLSGFAVVFAGSPIGAGYVLRWRVVVTRTTTLVAVDKPEDLYLRMPRANLMTVSFLNARSNTAYGFTELRVENTSDVAGSQAIIRVQVVFKSLSGFVIGVNPTPPTDNYFLRVRTP